MGMENLVILGAGQYGHVARETAVAMGCFQEICFLDDHSETAIGKLEDYRQLRSKFDCAFVAMGNPGLRMHWLQALEEAGYQLPVLIHPKAYVSPSAQLGKGSITEPMAVVNAGAEVGMGALLCAGCVVNHNAHVLPGCQIDCNAVVAANAVVPEGTKVQSGSVFEKK